MASFLVLAVAIVIVLSVAAQFFSLRTLRCAALISALVLVWYIISYGIAHWGTTHPNAPPPNLADAFDAGADAIVMTFLRPLVGGHGAPPGLIGRIVIAFALAIGYRTLEWRARQSQAPQLNSARLGDDQPGGNQADEDVEADAISAYAQLHAQLTAELRFRLAAIDVRSPAILPGGSRVSGLASVAEASGVGGAGLAGAIIRFLGSVWPGPRQFLLRVWVEPQSPSRSQSQSQSQSQPQPGRRPTARSPSTWRTRATATRSPPRRWPARTSMRRRRGWPGSSPGRSSSTIPTRRRGATAVPTAQTLARCCLPGRCEPRRKHRRPWRNQGKNRSGSCASGRAAARRPASPGTSSLSFLTLRAITWARSACMPGTSLITRAFTEAFTGSECRWKWSRTRGRSSPMTRRRGGGSTTSSASSTRAAT